MEISGKGGIGKIQRCLKLQDIWKFWKKKTLEVLGCLEIPGHLETLEKWNVGKIRGYLEIAGYPEIQEKLDIANIRGFPEIQENWDSRKFGRTFGVISKSKLHHIETHSIFLQFQPQIPNPGKSLKKIPKYFFLFS